MPDSLAAATYSLLDRLPAGVLLVVLATLAALCAWGMYVVGRPEPRPRRHPFAPAVDEGPQVAGTSLSSVASGRQQNRNGV